ncbi:hypothetical protein NC653_030436 [Populus alba x Populus x berolinensis]|uniref:Uncharacterized protein n=1 Tax=Populus alba x Populus x berolinensis TaxID=444605 RepID=A0AAD6LW23_9ROSI|nr:hypothetical protein NC653_030436 [Populus alba x Populus x berolinensis]
MVARTPPKQRKMVAPSQPSFTQRNCKEADFSVLQIWWKDVCLDCKSFSTQWAGGKKVIDGVSLSPRSTRGYLRTSLWCKQESLSIKSTAPKKSPVGSCQQLQ